MLSPFKFMSTQIKWVLNIAWQSHPWCLFRIFFQTSNIIFPMRILLSRPLRKYKEPEENSNKLSPPHFPATGPMCSIWSSATMNELGPSEDQLLRLLLYILSSFRHLSTSSLLNYLFSSLLNHCIWNLLSQKYSNILHLKSPFDPKLSSIYLLARAVSLKSCLYWSSPVLVLFLFYFLLVHSHQAFPQQSTKTVFEKVITSC